MPRKGRGGARQGTPGQAYGNRTDLAANRAPNQAPVAKAGQEYGERGRQEQAMTAMPLPDLANRVAALPGLTDPSARPDEPLTAGLPTGPGPGPTNRPSGSGAAGLIRRMLVESPDPELFELLAELDRSEAGGYNNLSNSALTTPTDALSPRSAHTRFNDTSGAGMSAEQMVESVGNLAQDAREERDLNPQVGDYSGPDYRKGNPRGNSPRQSD